MGSIWGNLDRIFTGTIHTYYYRLSQHYKAHPDDLKTLGYTILACAFILSFDKWGETAFDAVIGLGNFAAALVICTIGIGIHDIAHRITSVKMGYDIEHKIWFAGLIISIVLVLVSRGAVKVYLIEAMTLAPVRLYRAGRYPFMGTTWEYSLAYMSGPLASLIFAGILASIASAAGITTGLLILAVQFNLIYGLLALLPLPPLDGLWILYYSRGVYCGLIVGALAYTIMTQFGIAYWMPFAFSIVLGIISGIYWMKVHD